MHIIVTWSERPPHATPSHHASFLTLTYNHVFVYCFHFIYVICIYGHLCIERMYLQHSYMLMHTFHVSFYGCTRQNWFYRSTGRIAELVPAEDVERLESFDSFTQEEEELAHYLKEFGQTPPRTARQRRQKERDAYWWVSLYFVILSPAIPERIFTLAFKYIIVVSSHHV